MSTLWLTANLPPHQEMGFFRTVLPEAEVDRIRRLTRASDYLKYGHRGPMRPDTPTTTLREGDAISTFTFDRAPPESVTRVFDALDEVGKEIGKYPVFTLQGEARWKTSLLKRGGHVEVAVVLRSVGSELIAFDNPLGSTSTTWVGLRLTIAREMPDAQLDWEKDVKQIDLLPQHLLTADGKRPKGQPHRVELPSGGEFRFEARLKLLMPDGYYKGSLAFVGGSDGKTTQVVRGELTMDLGRLTVTQ